MLKGIKDFFKSSLLMARIANSQDLEAESKNLEALNLLNKYEESAKFFQSIEYFLIRSRLNHKLGRLDNALKDAFVAYEYFNKNEHFENPNNKAYLEKYLNFLLKNIYFNKNNDQWKVYNEKFQKIDISDVESEVESTFLQWLPLPNQE